MKKGKRKVIACAVTAGMVFGSVVPMAFAADVTIERNLPSQNIFDEGSGKEIPGVDYIRAYPSDCKDLQTYRDLTPVEVTAAEKHSGGQSLKIGFMKERDLKEDYLGISFNSVTEQKITQGNYILSLWVKTESVDGVFDNQGQRFHLTNDFAQRWNLQEGQIQGTQTPDGWSQYMIRFDVKDPALQWWESFPYMQLILEINGKGVLYLDDLELRKVNADISDYQTAFQESAQVIPIRNAGFEYCKTDAQDEFAADITEGWKAFRHFNSSVYSKEEFESVNPMVVTEAAAHSGMKGLNLAFDNYNTGNDYMGAVAKTKPLKPNTKYTVSMWVKHVDTDILKSKNASQLRLGRDCHIENTLKPDGEWQGWAAWEFLNNQPYQQDSSGWSQYIFSFTTNNEPNTADWSIEGNLQIEFKEKGSFYIDDIVINEGMVTIPDIENNLLVNGSFEEALQPAVTATQTKAYTNTQDGTKGVYWNVSAPGVYDTIHAEFSSEGVVKSAELDFSNYTGDGEYQFSVLLKGQGLEKQNVSAEFTGAVN